MSFWIEMLSECAMTYGELLGFIVLGFIILITIGFGMIILALQERMKRKPPER